MTDTVRPMTRVQNLDRPEGYTHRQILTILSGLLIAMFLAALDQTIVSTSIYKIGESLHGLTAQAWVTTSFLITSTITTPLYGKLSDQYGRKPFFMFAIAVFITGSVVCTLATSMYMLAAFRAFQGIGAGGLISLAMSIVGDIIPPRQRAKYQGYFVATFGTSSVLGPVVGGALAGQSTILGVDGWRWIFLINLPIGLLALVVVSKVLHVDHDRKPHKIDFAGATALTVALVPLLIVAEQGREWGWLSVSSLCCYVLGIGAIGAFLRAERAAGDEALLPLRMFRNSVYSLGMIVSTIVGIGMFGGITLIPIYLQVVKGDSPTRAGLLTLPLMAGLMSMSIVCGQITSRTGHYKFFPVIGSVLMTTGLLMLSRLRADSSLIYADVSMLLVGAGMGMTMQTIILAIQNTVGRGDIGVATSSATFFRQLGGTIGVSVFLSIVYSTVGGKISHAYATAATDPAFAAAAKADPAGLDRLRHIDAAALNDTSFLSNFSATLTHPFREGFTSSLTLCFVLAACVVIVNLALTACIREVPLRTVSGEFADEPIPGHF
jgi:EmrB/QacA subfamily drug resistance transporter